MHPRRPRPAGGRAQPIRQAAVRRRPVRRAAAGQLITSWLTGITISTASHISTVTHGRLIPSPSGPVAAPSRSFWAGSAAAAGAAARL